MPSLKDKIVLLEFCSDVFKEFSIYEFDRNLESLTQNKDFSEVKGLIIGRFQISSKITEEMILAVLDQKPILRSFTVVYDFDIGHTTPMLTLPIGGKVKLNTVEQSLLVYNSVFED